MWELLSITEPVYESDGAYGCFKTLCLEIARSLWYWKQLTYDAHSDTELFS